MQDSVPLACLPGIRPHEQGYPWLSAASRRTPTSKLHDPSLRVDLPQELGQKGLFSDADKTGDKGEQSLYADMCQIAACRKKCASAILCMA